MLLFFLPPGDSLLLMCLELQSEPKSRTQLTCMLFSDVLSQLISHNPMRIELNRVRQPGPPESAWLRLVVSGDWSVRYPCVELQCEPECRTQTRRVHLLRDRQFSNNDEL